MKIKDAAALCENFIAKYKKKSHIDYMITGHSIKFFFILIRIVSNNMVISQMN